MPLTHEEYTFLRARLEHADKMQQIENLQHRFAGFTAGVAAARYTQPQHTQAPQSRPVAQSVRPAAQPAQQPGRLPKIIDNNSRFYASHLKLKPATPQIDSVVDPYEPGRGKRI